jgi:hypothetical protein
MGRAIRANLVKNAVRDEREGTVVCATPRFSRKTHGSLPSDSSRVAIDAEIGSYLDEEDQEWEAEEEEVRLSHRRRLTTCSSELLSTRQPPVAKRAHECVSGVPGKDERMVQVPSSPADIGSTPTKAAPAKEEDEDGEEEPAPPKLTPKPAGKAAPAKAAPAKDAPAKDAPAKGTVRPFVWHACTNQRTFVHARITCACAHAHTRPAPMLH